MPDFNREMSEYLEDCIRHHPHWNLVRTDMRGDVMYITLIFENDTEVQIAWHKKHYH